MSTAAIRPDASERWFGPGSSIGRASRTMILIALASLAGHLLMVVMALLASQAPPAPPQEIAVEIVQDVPKPTPPAPKPVSREKPTGPAARVAAEPPPAAKPPPPPKAETVKPETAKPEPAKPLPPPKAAAAPPQPKVDAADKKLAALQKELETLRAEQASLKTEQDSLQAEHAADEAAARAQAQAPLRDAGLGPLPDSFQAVALPSASDGAGEATSYQEIVFSALAKAKGFGRTKGLPGSAGVRFSIDASGRLVDVELVHKSGVPSLDAQALDIVRRAAPFPPPPQGAQRSFSANVNFVTEGAP